MLSAIAKCPSIRAFKDIVSKFGQFNKQEHSDRIPKAIAFCYCGTYTYFGEDAYEFP